MKAVRQTVLGLMLVLLCGAVQAEEPKQEMPASAVDISSPTLLKALIALQQQTGLQFICPTEGTGETPVPAVSGVYTPRAAVDKLLKDSGLKYEFINERTVAIWSKSESSRPARITAIDSPKPASGTRLVLTQADPSSSNDAVQAALAQADSAASSRTRLDETSVSIPEILVQGSRILNTDIKRTRDDVQPYVIFDRTAIEQSATKNLEEFLKARLPMNTQSFTNAQVFTSLGATSAINLRGLGTNQTLILIDGRRTASTINQGTPGQPDLNGIPLSAVERIEVLPTTASGIYGGSATGGVINIVMRRDYSGLELRGNYDGTFDADASIYQFDFGTGFSLEGGKTSIMVTGSLAEAQRLPLGNRDFTERGRAAILANNGNNPLALNLFGIAPPLGATTNIMSFDGSPLFGVGTSNITSVPEGYAGGGGLAPLQANAGSYNLAQPKNAQEQGVDRSLLAGTQTRSLMGSVRREFSPRVEAFLEGNFASTKSTSELSGAFFSSYILPSSALTNPFGQDVWVTVPVNAADSLTTADSDTYRLAGGLIVSLSNDWSAGADYTWGRFYAKPAAYSDLSGAEASAIADGSLDVLRDGSVSPIDFSPYLNPRPRYSANRSTSGDAVLRIAGPAWTLPGGPLHLSGLLERRDERFATSSFVFPNIGSLVAPSRSQIVNSLYLEAIVPLVSSRNRRTGIESLEFQLSGRRDEYKIKGVTGTTFVPVGTPGDPIVRVEDRLTSNNPTLGLRYQPITDVTLRASYGTGFLPPGVDQLAPITQQMAAPFHTDPKRGNEPLGFVTLLGGGNPNLRPEESESWSAGMIFTPRFVEGLRLSIDWTRIEKTDNIISYPGGIPAIIADEDSLPGRVRRDSPAPGDPFGVGPITLVDGTLINIAHAKIDSYDVSLDYRYETGRLGAFDFYWLGTWQPHYQTHNLPTSEEIERAGINDSFPNKFKFNAGLSWRYRAWTLGWVTRYVKDYLVVGPDDPLFATIVINQGNGGRVPSQDYHDVLVRYSLHESTDWSLLNNTDVQLTVRNVFNTKPPFDADNVGPYYSLFGDPRLASYSLMVKKRF